MSIASASSGSARANLAAYFQLLGLRVALGGPPATPSSSTPRRRTLLLAGLLDDKLDHSLERAFRLLKVAHPREDIHRVYIACLSSDKRARANAGEFLDALLGRRDQQLLRDLVRLVSDDLPPEDQLTRAARLLGFTPPRSREDAVRAAIADPDIKLAALAALFAVAMGDQGVDGGAPARGPRSRPCRGRSCSREALLELRGAHA